MAAFAVVVMSTSCMIRLDSKKLEDSVTAAGNSRRSIKASGVYVSRDTVVADFSSIRMSGAMDVHFVQRPGPAGVHIHASDNIIRFVKVQSEKGVLSLSIKTPRNARIVGDWDMDVTVSAPDLSSLVVSGACEFECSALAVADGNFTVECSGASDVELKNLSAASLSAEISGASNFDVERLVTGDVRLTVSGASDMDLEDISVESVSAQVSGASELSLSGKAGSAEYVISGSSDVDAEELSCPATKVNASGASSVRYRDASGKLRKK